MNNRLTFRQVEYLREIDRQGSIAGACKELRISQSSILAAIRVAEETTGARLFNRRKGHGIELTPAGQKFLVSARRFLAAGSDFFTSLDQFSRSRPATVRLGCFSPLGALLIPPVLKRFVAAHGDCEFILFEGDQIELRNWLATGALDLVVTYDIGEEYGSAITPICKFPAHALVRADDPLTEKGAVSMEELSQRPLILLDLPETRTYLMALFDFVARRPKVGLRTRSYETIRSAVSNGLGVSVLNIRPSLEASPDGPDLKRIPISDKLRQPTLLVADPYGEQKPGYVRAFIHALYRYLADLGPERFSVVLPEFAQDLLYPEPDLRGRNERAASRTS